ncbi:MAG: glycosyltransferase [Acetobacteraceae bacterium]
MPVRADRTGFHVAADDPTGLAEKIIAAWADPARLAEIGRRARLLVEATFTWERVVDRLAALLSPPAGLAGDDRFPHRA